MEEDWEREGSKMMEKNIEVKGREKETNGYDKEKRVMEKNEEGKKGKKQ